METESLATALEREHREIDEGIEAFLAGPPAARDEEALTRAVYALRRHIYLEEEFLFPPLREAGLVGPVLVMLREHAQMWRTLDALERELGTDAAAARETCEDLTLQLQNHNIKEEKILYPQADRILAAPASDRLRTFIDSGKLPGDWVCELAQG